MLSFKNFKTNHIILIVFLYSFKLMWCNGKIPWCRCKKIPRRIPAERIKKNMARGEEALELMDMGKGKQVLEFLNLQVLMNCGELLLISIDFMPLASVNYSGGVIVTDWYSTDQKFK